MVWGETLKDLQNSWSPSTNKHWEPLYIFGTIKASSGEYMSVKRTTLFYYQSASAPWI